MNSAPQKHRPSPSLLDQQLESTPANYRREGEDWFAIFNRDVPRQLDIRLLHTFQHDSPVTCVRFSPNGRYIATCCKRTAQIFDVETGDKVVTLNNPAEPTGDSYVRSVCFPLDGRYLAVALEIDPNVLRKDNPIRLWDIARKKVSTIFVGHEADIYSLDISRDGQRLASSSGDRTARFWDGKQDNVS